MRGPVDIANAEHYRWGDGCDGWHLLREADLSVIEERMPEATSEARHRHARARQFFRVLAGRLRIEVGGRVHALEPGQGLHIAPGLAHQVHNDGPGAARFLVVSTPPSHGDRIAAPPEGNDG